MIESEWKRWEMRGKRLQSSIPSHGLHLFPKYITVYEHTAYPTDTPNYHKDVFIFHSMTRIYIYMYMYICIYMYMYMYMYYIYILINVHVILYYVCIYIYIYYM